MLRHLKPVDALAPPPASASFVRPPPAFRLATTSLWVPTHSPDKHGGRAAADWGDSSGRSQESARAIINAERAAGTADAAASLTHTSVEPTAAATPSENAPSHTVAGAEAAPDDRSIAPHLAEDGLQNDGDQAAGMVTAAPDSGGDAEPATTAAVSWEYREVPQVRRRTPAVNTSSCALSPLSLVHHATQAGETCGCSQGPVQEEICRPCTVLQAPARL